MARIDHSRTNARDRMARHGVDSIADMGIPGGLQPPRPRQSKAELRRQLEAATAKISRIIRCGGCGHSASVVVPASKLRARFKCSKCGEVAK